MWFNAACFLRNVGKRLRCFLALHLRRKCCSYLPIIRRDESGRKDRVESWMNEWKMQLKSQQLMNIPNLL
jgi:hypothetical protein